MKIPIFLSRPTPHLEAQVQFVEELKRELSHRGFDPHTLGPGSSYDYDAPLVGIRRILAHCCGLVSIAFRRTHVTSSAKNLGADIAGRIEELSSDVWLTWSCRAYVPVSELIYAAFRSNAKGLLPPSDE